MQNKIFPVLFFSIHNVLMPSYGNVSRLDALAANMYSDDANIFVKTNRIMS